MTANHLVPGTSVRVIHQLSPRTVNKQTSYYLEASPNGTLPSGVVGYGGDNFTPVSRYADLESQSKSLQVWQDGKVTPGRETREKNGKAEAEELSYLSAASGSVKVVAPGMMAVTTNVYVEGHQVIEEMSYLLTR